MSAITPTLLTELDFTNGQDFHSKQFSLELSNRLYLRRTFTDEIISLSANGVTQLNRNFNVLAELTYLTKLSNIADY